MKIRFLLLCISLLYSTLLIGQTKKAVFVIVDSIPADVLEKVATPSLDAIAWSGAYLRAHVGGDKDTYSQTPTISAVGYNSLLTGTWVNKHNVWDNDIQAPNYHYPTIFRLFKNQYPAKKTAVFSSWTDNRTKLVGAGLSETQHLKLDYHADGYELDTVTFPHDKQRNFMHAIDEKVTAEAAKSILTQAPDLSWVYLEYTDDMGHMHGDGEPFYEAIRKMDAQIGRLWAAIQQRQKQAREDWLIVITTDHGRDEKSGHNHGGQSDRQRSTWIVLNQPNLNAYARTFEPGIVDIMPTLARHLNVTIPTEVAREVDGIPLTGPVSLANVRVNHYQNQLDLTWTALETKGNAKIWVTATNNAKQGGKDTYQLLAEVPLTQRHAVVDVQKLPSEFYKIVIEGPSSSAGRWVVKAPEK